jgi:lysophospholipase L1-like esterase
MPVGPLTRIAVTYYSSGFIPLSTFHAEARQTGYASVPGNFLSAERMIVQQTFGSHYLLSAIHVRAAAKTHAVVCFGDSITDGDGSSIDGDRRWPDLLSERLQQTRGFEHVAVLNQGICGNRLLYDGGGEKGIQRFDRDVLSLPGATHAIILIGINDIVFPNTVLAGANEYASAADLISGFAQLLARARLSRLKVLFGTILPFEDALPDTPIRGCYTPEREGIRQTVNHWIRTESGADGVIDFDAALRDPARPTRLLPKYDSGDHVHPGDAGYRVMASAVDLSLLR